MSETNEPSTAGRPGGVMSPEDIEAMKELADAPATPRELVHLSEVSEWLRLEAGRVESTQQVDVSRYGRRKDPEAASLAGRHLRALADRVDALWGQS